METFKIPKFHITNQYLSALERSKLDSGLIVHSSTNSTKIIPFINREIVDHAKISLPLGGKHI